MSARLGLMGLTDQGYQNMVTADPSFKTACAPIDAGAKALGSSASLLEPGRGLLLGLPVLLALDARLLSVSALGLKLVASVAGSSVPSESALGLPKICLSVKCLAGA